MRKLFLLVLALLATTGSFAQKAKIKTKGKAAAVSRLGGQRWPIDKANARIHWRAVAPPQ